METLVDYQHWQYMFYIVVIDFAKWALCDPDGLIKFCFGLYMYIQSYIKMFLHYTKPCC